MNERKTQMKALTLIALALTLSTNAFAGAAVAYTCVGKNKVNNEAVVFEVIFADHAHEVGYTNQSVTVLKRGWQDLATPITFQMFGANAKNNCKKNSNEEINMHGGFEMDTVPGDLADFAISFKSACREDQKFDVKGLCYFQ
jgi:hypothetical protein